MRWACKDDTRIVRQAEQNRLKYRNEDASKKLFVATEILVFDFELL